MTETEGLEVWVRAKAFDIAVGAELPPMAIRNMDVKIVESITASLVLQISTWIAARRHPEIIRSRVIEFQPGPKEIEFQPAPRTVEFVIPPKKLTFTSPDTWWQHLKEALYLRGLVPGFIQRHWPVRYVDTHKVAEWEPASVIVTWGKMTETAEWPKMEQTITWTEGPYLLCPHINKITDREHLKFLMEAKGE